MRRALLVGGVIKGCYGIAAQGQFSPLKSPYDSPSSTNQEAMTKLEPRSAGLLVSALSRNKLKSAADHKPPVAC
jgi:hypothetical protein